MALRFGDYRQVQIAHEQFTFERAHPEQTVLVSLNASSKAACVPLEGIQGTQLTDLLNEGEVVPVRKGRASINLPPTWLRVLRVG
ncbi:MAG: alpha-glucosidase C-terminal domain-containing protein [Chloroflexota bacterium]